MLLENIKTQIATVPDFPIPGIQFRDITPLLASPYFHDAIRLMGEKVQKPDYWVGVEARGFIFASALATMFGGGLLLCRKAGKLPPPVVTLSYGLEYGNDTLQMKPGCGNVVIVDDVLATGGTFAAAENLVVKAGYTIVDKLVLINLPQLNQRHDVKYLLEF